MVAAVEGATVGGGGGIGGYGGGGGGGGFGGTPMTEAVVPAASAAAGAAPVASETATWRPAASEAGNGGNRGRALAALAAAGRAWAARSLCVSGGSLTVGKRRLSPATPSLLALGAAFSGPGVGANGSAYGSGIFLNGSGTFNFAPSREHDL